MNIFPTFTPMQNNKSLLDQYSQNVKLRIMMVTPTFGHLSPEEHKQYGDIHCISFYYFLFMTEGEVIHGVDLQEYKVKEKELLFVLPHEIHKLPAKDMVTDISRSDLTKTVCRLCPNNTPFWSTHSTTRISRLRLRQMPG